MAETQVIAAQADSHYGIVADAVLAEREGFPECAAIAGQAAGDGNADADDAGYSVHQGAPVDLDTRAEHQDGLEVGSLDLPTDSFAGRERVVHPV
ncbi:hypothetical protein SDC9_199236 [bioreactor metagenome]|uniref:Uncharacterized protein n=1 Tax=bioreactor metagenome TaxID=1076179 RepID=A0A645IJW7_9ZZZZ